LKAACKGGLFASGSRAVIAAAIERLAEPIVSAVDPSRHKSRGVLRFATCVRACADRLRYKQNQTQEEFRARSDPPTLGLRAPKEVRYASASPSTIVAGFRPFAR
jgi:hypothetical protein